MSQFNCPLLNIDGKFDQVYYITFFLKYNNILYYYKIDSFIDIILIKGKWSFFFNIIGIAGIPPILGFFLKWLAFFYILNIRYIFVFFILLISVTIFYVYIRLVYDLILGNRVDMGWVNKKNFFKIIRERGLYLN